MTTEVLAQGEPRSQAARLGPFSPDHIECLLDDLDAWMNRNGRTFFALHGWWGDVPCPELPLMIDFCALESSDIPREQWENEVRCNPLSVAFVILGDALPFPASRFRWPGDTDCAEPLLPFPFVANVVELGDGIPPQLGVSILTDFNPTISQTEWCSEILRTYERRGFVVWWWQWDRPTVGMSRDEHSKYVKSGFRRTDTKPPERCRFPNDSGEQITNVAPHPDCPDDPRYYVPMQLEQILSILGERFGGWPRRIDNVPFVLNENGEPNFLDTTSKLFAWYQKFGLLKWRDGVGCVSKAEFREAIGASNRRYSAIESLPHEPPFLDRFYLRPAPDPGDGRALEALLDRFTPETEHDRQLIAAMFASVVWGETGGQRPAFLLTADVGRGAGKTTLARMLAELAGGKFEIHPSEDEGRIKNRLLSPESLTLRVALIDNLKSMKFSWDFVEGLITCDSIGGHRLYCGNATRPNNLIWVMTVNGASLSTDMAQRTVTIKLGRPKRAGDWQEETTRFIRENRQLILADLIALLRREKQPLKQHSRHARWESEILSRLEQPDELQRLIAERQHGNDAEADEARMIEEHFCQRLADLGLDNEIERLFIPNEIVVRWFAEATGERVSNIAVGRRLAQMVTEGRIKRLESVRHKTHGRGLQWNGEQAFGEPDYEAVKRVIEAREQEKRRPRWSG